MAGVHQEKYYKKGLASGARNGMLQVPLTEQFPQNEEIVATSSFGGSIFTLLFTRCPSIM